LKGNNEAKITSSNEKKVLKELKSKCYRKYICITYLTKDVESGYDAVTNLKQIVMNIKIPKPVSSIA